MKIYPKLQAASVFRSSLPPDKASARLLLQYCAALAPSCNRSLISSKLKCETAKLPQSSPQNGGQILAPISVPEKYCLFFWKTYIEANFHTFVRRLKSDSKGNLQGMSKLLDLSSVYFDFISVSVRFCTLFLYMFCSKVVAKLGSKFVTKPNNRIF